MSGYIVTADEWLLRDEERAEENYMHTLPTTVTATTVTAEEWAKLDKLARRVYDQFSHISVMHSHHKDLAPTVQIEVRLFGDDRGYETGGHINMRQAFLSCYNLLLASLEKDQSTAKKESDELQTYIESMRL